VRQILQPRRCGLVLALTLVLAGSLAPAPAAARKVRVPVVAGQSFYYVQWHAATSDFSSFVAVGPAGTRFTIGCAEQPPRLCGAAPFSITLDRAGVHRSNQRLRARVGGVVELTTIARSGVRRITSLTVRSNRAPAVSRRCLAADGVTPIDCFVTCNTKLRVPPGDRCFGAGKRVPLPRQDGDADWTSKRTRFTRLVLTRIQHDTFVTVKCFAKGRACPFSLRATLVRSGRLDVGRMLRRRWLPVGSVVEVGLFKGLLGGKLVRYTIRSGQVPRVTNLCVEPGITKPHRCR
jgi:hypothetical protein